MTAKVISWTSDKPPTEEQIRSILAQEELHPYAWSNGPGDVYSAHAHPYNKVIYVVRGSIQFGLPQNDETLTLHAGDRLELPSGVTHDAQVGSQGVLCLEAHH